MPEIQTQSNINQKPDARPVSANATSPQAGSETPQAVETKLDRDEQENFSKAPSAALPPETKSPEVPEAKAAETKHVLNDAVKAKLERLKAFIGLAEKASIFEFAMAVLGTVTTGFQADWVSYMHESFAEFMENHLGAASEGGKQVNPLAAGLLKGLAFLGGIKRDGKSLKTTDDFVQNQSRLIGALNMLTSTVSGMFVVFRSIPNFIKGHTPTDLSEISPPLHFLSTKVLPTVNAGLMWMTGAGKRSLALDLQKDSYHPEVREHIDGAFLSGTEDYLCGMNSAGLMLRQAISKINPVIGNALEPLFASWIAVSAFKAGYEGYTQREEEEEPRFDLNTTLDKVLRPGSYALARAIAKPLKVDLPKESELNLAV